MADAAAVVTASPSTTTAPPLPPPPAPLSAQLQPPLAPVPPFARIVPETFTVPAVEIWTAPPPAPPVSVAQAPPLPPLHPPMRGVGAAVPRTTPPAPGFPPPPSP